MLMRENVTLAPAQSVGPSKRGNRNIIPITGGELSGRITGKVLMGGADFQNLSPPATIDAHYLWQADNGEIIIVRNGGSFGSLCAELRDARRRAVWVPQRGALSELESRRGTRWRGAHVLRERGVSGARQR
jgi:hypothetical protein